MGYQNERMLRKAGILPPLATKKEKKPIAKKSEKKLAQEMAEKEALGGEDTLLVKWFRNKMKLMIGHCAECGLATETHVYKYAINSICHILPKRDTVCPSVKYHPSNWIELCPHHHDQFDKQGWEEKEKWGSWYIVKQRLISLYPDLAENEKRHFPESVRKFIEETEPF